ncbi:amidase domain-containing protein [Sarocladium implicatum]|nr:amidase domain-containing protein [Sarocladium implicatum]
MSTFSIPARPYAFEFPFDKTALIIIDIQRDFVDPGGFGSIQCGNDAIFKAARAVVPATLRVLDLFRAHNAHVIHTREGHRPDLSDLPSAKRLRQISAPGGHHDMGIGDKGPMGRLLVRGEYGHDIVDELTPWPTETVIDKPGKGSFWGTGMHRVLLDRGVTHLLFAGVTTECCVTTTVRECNDRGFQCCIMSDCTQGFDENQVTTSLDIICGQDGLFGFIGHSADVLNAIPSEPTRLAVPKPAIPETGPLPSLHELQALYKSGSISPTDVVNAVYDRIEKHEKVDPAVWISRATREEALSATTDLISRYRDKPVPSLFGIPFSVKDNIDVAGYKTTSACEAYTTTPENHAVAVQHVLDAGGIFIGKTNLDQLATGLSGCRSPFGTPQNSFSSAHIPGGSSSGGAVAVGSSLVCFSLTTDTAGSTRIPAALNGVVGLKPTKGTVSANGLIPACKSLDTIGVMARTVSDTRAVWRVISQHDSSDPYSKLPHTLSTWHVDFRGLEKGGFTFAIPPASALEACSPKYRELFTQAAETLESCGGQKRDIDYSVLERAGDLLYKGALLHERIACIGEQFLRSSTSAANGSHDQSSVLHPVTRELFSDALAASPSAYDVFRDQALQTQLTRLAQQSFDTLNGGVDVLLVPATVCHPTLDEMAADPLELNLKLGKFTHFGNVVDLCGVSVPVAEYKDEEGTTLPFGVTVMGGSGFDAKVLEVAKILEQAANLR